MFNKIFNKQEIKSHSRDLSLFQLLEGNFNYQNNPQEFINFYSEACPVFTATKLIADAGAAINILVKDTKKDEFVDHEVLKLLNKPNHFTTGNLFMKQILSYYILTGNDYINVVGSTKPVELNVIKPSDVTIQSSSKDGYAQSYSYCGANDSYNYKRDVISKRFFDSQKNEMLHLRDFNPDFSSDILTGSSAFLGCQLEISQYIAASVHNNSLLKNQARPSGFLTYKGSDDLSDSQVSGLKEEINNRLSGAKNTGRAAFLGGNFDWIQMSESIKDMDFPTLKKSTAEACYSAVQIPLPMISSESMSFNNYDAAKYSFYDNSVLPRLKAVLNFLTTSLMPRYKNSENLILTYDESSIECLENRKFENSANAFTSGLITRNEGRTLIGYESSPGGDDFYQPANLVPVGSDNYTSDNRETPSEKAQYIRLMQERKGIDGKRLYSDDFIKKNAVIYYG